MPGAAGGGPAGLRPLKKSECVIYYHPSLCVNTCAPIDEKDRAMLRAIAFLTLVLSPSLLSAQQALPDYKQWRSACAKLPANRELKGKLPDKKLLPLPAFADFERALDAFLRVEREGPLADAKTWVGKQPDPKVFFDFTRSWYGGKEVPFQPFAAKLVLPNDAVAIIMGDLHGDVRSLLRTLDELNERKILDGFRFRESKYRFLFLGDFTDRGAYGTEVLYTLFRLKIGQPGSGPLRSGQP